MDYNGVIIISIIMNACQKIDTFLNVTPRDTEVMISESTYLNCSTSLLAYQVQWRHVNNYVYTGLAILEPYNDGRFSVEIDALTGASNLVIQSVRTSDAGTYECAEDEGTGERRSVQLIVLDGDPVCKSNMHSDGVIGPNSCGIEAEEVEFSCSIKYYGNSLPVLQWKAIGGNQCISEGRFKVTWSNNEVTYTLTMKSTLGLNNSSFICQTTRTSDKHYSCSTDVINIIYIFNSEVKVNLTMNDAVNCLANTSQSCSYKWELFNGDSSSTESNNQILKPKKVGVHWCEATCLVRNKPCSVESMRATVFLEGATNRQQWMPSLALVLVPALSVVGVIVYCWIKRKDKKRQLDEIRRQTEEERESILESMVPEDCSGPKCVQKVDARCKLPCTHALCQNCVKNMKEKANRSDNLSCPICRGLFSVTVHPEGRADQPKYVREKYKHEIKLAHNAGVTIQKGKVMGMTVLGDDLFIICKSYPSVIFKYDIDAIDENNQEPWIPVQLSIADMKRPRGIAASETYRFVYIIDWQKMLGGRLWRYKYQRGQEAKQEGPVAILDKQPFGISVSQKTDEVLVTCATPAKCFARRGWLYIYTPSGSNALTIRTIELPELEIPRHSILASSSKFIICHGSSTKSHGVTSYLCDETGHARKKSFYGNICKGGSGKQEMNRPLSMIQDEDGLILVVDYYNHRIQLLTEDLRLVRHLITSGITYPRHLCLHAKTGRLYVGQKDGNVQIFDALIVEE